MPPPPPTARRPGSPPTGPCRYVGLGGVLARLGRTDDALGAYAAALDRAPDDEVALQGRAESWPPWAAGGGGRRRSTGCRPKLEREGRLADACDVARRALELAEARGRRRQVADLVARAARPWRAGDAAAAEALERALARPRIGARASAATGGGVGAATDARRRLRHRIRWC